MTTPQPPKPLPFGREWARSAPRVRRTGSPLVTLSTAPANPEDFEASWYPEAPTLVEALTVPGECGEAFELVGLILQLRWMLNPEPIPAHWLNEEAPNFDPPWLLLPGMCCTVVLRFRKTQGGIPVGEFLEQTPQLSKEGPSVAFWGKEIQPSDALEHLRRLGTDSGFLSLYSTGSRFETAVALQKAVLKPTSD